MSKLYEIMDKKNVIADTDLNGITLIATRVKTSFTKDESNTYVDEKTGKEKPVLTESYVRMEFPLKNVPLKRILVQALNNTKTDISNDLRRRVNAEFKEEGTSETFDSYMEFVEQEQPLKLMGLPGKYPTAPPTVAGTIRLTEQAIDGLATDEDKLKAIEAMEEQNKRRKKILLAKMNK